MREAMDQLVREYQAPPWRPEIIERVKKALPMLRQLVEDIEWIESTQAAEDMTEEQRYYADHLLSVRPGNWTMRPGGFAICSASREPKECW